MMQGIIMAQSSLAFRRLLTGVVMLAAAAPAFAESPAPEILSPLLATPIAPPNPVLGADARRHLVYEIVLMDIGESAIALKKIEVLDANNDAVLSALEGEALAKILRLTGAGKGTALPAGGSGAPAEVTAIATAARATRIVSVSIALFLVTGQVPRVLFGAEQPFPRCADRAR